MHWQSRSGKPRCMNTSKSSSSSPYSARALDHLVLPVESLEAARARLTSLGFTVAPDARHPFGTENACVFFKDGTYLEPLAIAQREECEAAAIKGNVFVARDQAWRFRNGENGGSAIAFGTEDAKADQKFFESKGISAGKMLRFQRKFNDGKGNSGTGKFALAAAGDLRSPDSFLFTCERVAMPEIDRSKQLRHKNGVRSLREVVLSEPNPSDFQYLLQDVLRQRDVNAHSFGMDVAAANANLAVLNPAGMQSWFGLDRKALLARERGLRIEAAIFGVSRLEKLREVLKKNAVKWREKGNRILVDPAPGQGIIYAFEEGK